MLKKRILASSLASVMALSSVSVVAFADETATSDIKTEAVSKAQLKEYVESLEDFVDNELQDYGSVQSEQFDNAYAAAQAVIDDKEATDDDATAVYQMLKAVKNSLKMYTNAELKELVDDAKADYETENIMNEDFGDKIWTDKSWKAFSNAYDTAEGCVDDDDQRVINDAYTDLKNAINGLEELDKVTKSQFRSAYTSYIELVNEFQKYEGWRRGTATVGVNSGELKYDKTAVTDPKEQAKADFTDKVVTFAELQGIIYGTSDDSFFPASMVDAAKEYKSGTWIKWSAIKDANDANAATDVKSFVNNAYEVFTGNKNSNQTTRPEIVAAYNACVDAVKVFNGWEVDNVKRGSKSACTNLINDDYRSDILGVVYPGPTSSGGGVTTPSTALNADNLPLKSLNTAVTSDVGEVTVPSAGTVKLSIKAQKTFKLKVEPETGLILTTATGAYNDAGNDGASPTPNAVPFEEVEFKGSTEAGAADIVYDITDRLPIKQVNIGTTLDAACKGTTKFSVAQKVLDNVIALDESDADTKDYAAAMTAMDATNTINSLGVVTSTSPKSMAYPLIYRALTYALEDNFPVKDTYKKKDVVALIEKANKLIDETGDAAMFQAKNAVLDKARKAAIDWVAMANADKAFKDKGEGVNYKAGTTAYTYDTIQNGANATTVYNKLNDKYKDLKKQADQYPYSYGDVADTLVDVAEGIDAGVYGASASKIKAAADDIAFDMSTLTEFKTDGNFIFDDDRVFVPYNRLDSKGTDGEKALYKKYEALLAAMEEAAKEPEVVLGDLTGDGVATPEDAIMIVKAFVGEITLTDAQQAAADFNGDGVVNADDALAVVKAYVGL